LNKTAFQDSDDIACDLRAKKGRSTKYKKLIYLRPLRCIHGEQVPSCSARDRRSDEKL